MDNIYATMMDTIFILPGFSTTAWRMDLSTCQLKQANSTQNLVCDAELWKATMGNLDGRTYTAGPKLTWPSNTLEKCESTAADPCNGIRQRDCRKPDSGCMW